MKLLDNLLTKWTDDRNKLWKEGNRKGGKL